MYPLSPSSPQRSPSPSPSPSPSRLERSSSEASPLNTVLGPVGLPAFSPLHNKSAACARPGKTLAQVCTALQEATESTKPTVGLADAQVDSESLGDTALSRKRKTAPADATWATPRHKLAATDQDSAVKVSAPTDGKAASSVSLATPVAAVRTARAASSQISTSWPAQDYTDVPQLVDLIAHGNFNKVWIQLRKLTTEQRNAIRSADGENLLHLACRATPFDDRASMLGKLVSLQIDVAAQDQNGDTPLHLLAQNTDTIRRDFEALGKSAPAANKIKNKAGWTPHFVLMGTSARRHPEVFADISEYLLRQDKS